MVWIRKRTEGQPWHLVVLRFVDERNGAFCDKAGGVQFFRVGRPVNLSPVARVVTAWRQRILGIGCEGLLVRIVRIKLEGRT